MTLYGRTDGRTDRHLIGLGPTSHLGRNDYSNHLIGTLKPQNNGLLYISTVIGTLAVDGWAVTFGTARRGLGGLGCTNFITFDVAL